jgi:ribonuclease PH
MSRQDNRDNYEIRKIEITRNYTKYAQGSVLISFGDTKILCTAFVEDKVPPFMRGTGLGWVSAEYAMLPSSVMVRKQRDINKGRLDGRSAEIQRLIGRSLRSIVDMKKLGERTIWIDCDVLQADGGTRTCSVTGAYIALKDCVDYLLSNDVIKENPIKCAVAAISLGIVRDEILVDLSYDEDSIAQVDMNVVMTQEGEFTELQTTGERRPISYEELISMLDAAKFGIEQVFEVFKNDHQSK